MGKNPISDDEDALWRAAIRERVIEGRTRQGWSQQEMADLLEIEFDAYRKYEQHSDSRHTVMPTRLMPRFCKLTRWDLEAFISGPKSAKIETAAPKGARRRTSSG